TCAVKSAADCLSVLEFISLLLCSPKTSKFPPPWASSVLQRTTAFAASDIELPVMEYLLCLNSVRGGEIRVDLLAYLHHPLAAEAVARGELGDRFEVVILSARQAPVEHTRRRVANVLERMDHVARDEYNGASACRIRFATDRQFIGALDDEEYLFLVEMAVVRRAFTGFVPSHQDRNGAAGGLGGEEYSHVEAKRLDGQRLFEVDNGGLQR